jgi:hypothetical protein
MPARPRQNSRSRVARGGGPPRAPAATARILFVPHQTDGLEAAGRLGRWTARALAGMRERDGGAVLRLGDLLDLRTLVPRAAGARVPPEPAALAVAGAPAFVAELGRRLRAEAGRRLLARRLRADAPLPVAAVADEGELHVGDSPELIPHAEALARSGWAVILHREGVLDEAVAPAAAAQGLG